MLAWLKSLFSPVKRAPTGGATSPITRYEPVAQEPTIPIWATKIPPRVTFVDVETTGLTEQDRIVSIAVIRLDRAELIAGYMDLKYVHVIVDPGRKSHPSAERIHGYSDWLLRHQDPFKDHADSISFLLSETDLVVAHNTEFDIPFINKELVAVDKRAISVPTYCTMERHRKLMPGTRASLDAVAAHIGYARRGRHHGALEDAWLAMLIYLRQNDCRAKHSFSYFPNPIPTNLRDAPAMPDGKLPRRKSVPKLKNSKPDEAEQCD